ncbi:MAG: methyltransferase domain-containing protein, partial [Thermoplasmata archaeon]|nr:methyltransferase domain-containing protein [Thermoplasmata archaeon]
FRVLARQLGDNLARSGIRLEPHSGGRLTDGEVEFGTVTRWEPGEELRVTLQPVNWAVSPAVDARMGFEGTSGGTQITVEIRGWRGALEGSGGELIDWAAGALLPNLYRQFSPVTFGEWIMDQHARRPSGESARAQYRDPTYHWPNFLLILDRLHLSAGDRLVEVGCGGGAFLCKALESGCSATGVDHSPEMVRLAREVNRVAIEEGRLELIEGDASHLPVSTNSFTSCVSTGAFNFFPDPVAALREMYRALAPGGRLAIFTDTAAARGTPAAPEPFASRSRFYEPEEIANLARMAGFSDVHAEEPDLGPYAKAARLPDEVAAAFEGAGGALLLLAVKPLKS